MSETSGFGTPDGGTTEDATERARQLRQQADWCVGMAAKVIDPQIFRAYVDAAAVYQQQALALGGGPLGVKSPA